MTAPARRPVIATVVHIGSALVVAAIVAAAPIGLASLALIPAAFVVALAHAILLGAPLLAILWWKRWIGWLTAAAAGFAVGAAGIAFLTWPLAGSGSSWVNGVATRTDGVPTPAGWIDYLQGVAMFGALGAAGGLGFWLWLRLAGVVPVAAYASDTPARRLRYTDMSLPLVVALGAGSILSVSVLTQDKSCHNVLRDGRSSIGSELRIDLDIDHAEWPVLEQEFESFAAAHSLSFRNNSEERPGIVRMLYLSACTEDMTISAAEHRWASRGYRSLIDGRGVGINIYQPGESGGWQVLAEDLCERLESRWPGRVRFRNGEGQLIPRPDFRPQ